MITTLLAWGSVYGLLLTIFWVFGPQLAALPAALRLLLVSGVLVGLMANLVMPAVTRLVDRAPTTTRHEPIIGSGTRRRRLGP